MRFVQFLNGVKFSAGTLQFNNLRLTVFFYRLLVRYSDLLEKSKFK